MRPILIAACALAVLCPIADAQISGRKELNTLPEVFTSTEHIATFLANDLEAVTIPAFPVIAEIKERLMALGAIGAMMSGSGPTVFGMFNSRTDADHAHTEIIQNSDWFVETTETI